MQERRNSCALPIELPLSCINLSMWVSKHPLNLDMQSITSMAVGKTAETPAMELPDLSKASICESTPSTKYCQNESNLTLNARSCGHLLSGHLIIEKHVFAVINSLRPSDAIWRRRSESTLAQVMACCLTAPSHYLNQYWLIISKV